MIEKPIDEPLYQPRSYTDRRRDVIKVLSERPDISNRRIARITGCSRELVNRIRSNLVRMRKLADYPARVAADGKTYRHVK